jgi:hypothetical protein
LLNAVDKMREQIDKAGGTALSSMHSTTHHCFVSVPFFCGFVAAFFGFFVALVLFAALAGFDSLPDFAGLADFDFSAVGALDGDASPGAWASATPLAAAKKAATTVRTSCFIEFPS